MNTDKLEILHSSMSLWRIKLQNFHWNVQGIMFFELHEELERTFDGLAEVADGIAEKIVMQGRPALGNYSSMAQLTLIEEATSAWRLQKEICTSVYQDAQKLIDFIVKVEWDALEQPLIDEVLIFLDKTQWQYKANTQ